MSKFVANMTTIIFGCDRVNGKLIRSRTETRILTVARLDISVFFQNHRWLAVNDGN
jgi:hypothetical protein